VNTVSLPQLDRQISKIGVIVLVILFNVVARPLNWVLVKLGREPLLATLMGRSGRHFDKAFAGYAPTAHDVFVTTFAKSGTNWMMQIAHQIAFRGAGEYAHIHDVICWPDLGPRRARRMAIPLSDTRVQAASPTGLRVIKTHLAASRVPFSDKARYLVVVRDPKEVLVSSYFFAAGVAGPLMPSADTWFELFFSDRFPFNFGNSWAEHTASYWALRDKPNVLVLLFREMKQDLPGAVRKVADLLDVRLTEAEMSAVIEKSTFSFMKTIEHKFTLLPKGALPWGEGLTMMREGRSGNSKELLTPAQQRRIDAWCAQELERLGSDFPYERIFALPGASQASEPSSRLAASG